MNSASITRLNHQELDHGIPDSASWHNDYKDSAWVKIRGLSPKLSEGDVLCLFSQFGEIDDLNLVRDREGKKILVCLIKFEQFRSAWLTVDNFNDVELLGSKITVDHHREAIRRPKRGEEAMSVEEKLARIQPGAAYADQTFAQSDASLTRGVDVFATQSGDKVSSWKQQDVDTEEERKRKKKEKKERKERKKSNKKGRYESDDD